MIRHDFCDGRQKNAAASRDTVKIARELRESGSFLFCAVIFRLLLEISYRDFVSPYFSYLGFVLEPNLIKYTESWVIYGLLLIFAPKRLSRPSDFLVVYLLFAFLLPVLVFYAMTNSPREHLYLVVLGVLLVFACRLGKPIGLPVLKEGPLTAAVVSILACIFATGWMISSGGLAFFNLDFTRVYEFRSEVGDVLNVGLMAYLVTWTTKVFGPILLALAIWRKNYLSASIILGLHVLWFGISSHKAVLFYPFLVLFLWAWFRSTRALALIPLGMSMVVGSAYVIFLLFSDVLIPSLLIRRAFFVPANLTFAYYEFFTQNPPIYWSNSIASWLFDYPYDVSPAEVIGRFMGTGSYANNSFLATGFMHAGVPGVAIYGAIVGFLFRIIDSVGNMGVSSWFAIASVIVPAHSLLVGADLLTAILTHGLALSIVMLFLLRSGTRTSGIVAFRARNQHDADKRLVSR